MRPLSLKPYDRKYYGTIILNSDGNPIVKFWTAKGTPSRREKERFGPDWSLKDWNEYMKVDSHWECEADLAAAELVISFVNGLSDLERLCEGLGSDAFTDALDAVYSFLERSRESKGQFNQRAPRR